MQATESLKEENAQLKKDLAWLANQTQMNKQQADQAIGDLQAYNQILRGMERKLAETQQAREVAETELK